MWSSGRGLDGATVVKLWMSSTSVRHFMVVQQ